MPKYLIRRRNRYGQWAHIETMDVPPSRDQIKWNYGPGEYNIMVAEEGIRGLQNYASYTIPYSIEYVGWTPDRPNAEYIYQQYGQGNYFVMGKAMDIKPVIVPTAEDEMVKDLMMQGVNVMRGVYVIFRLTGVPYR